MIYFSIFTTVFQTQFKLHTSMLPIKYFKDNGKLYVTPTFNIQ
jgi:hypothetical protein